jgi:hypothetical protein
MFGTEFVEKIKTHFVNNNFFFENRAVYEKMWKNKVDPDSPQMTIWRTRIACWIPKDTNTHTHTHTHTHTGCVILIVFPPQQWLHERASLLRYTDVARLGMNGPQSRSTDD